MASAARNNSFYMHLRARALIGRKDYVTALKLLESDDAGDNAWQYVWRACAQNGLGLHAEAQESIQRAKILAREQGIQLWMVEPDCRKLFDI